MLSAKKLIFRTLKLLVIFYALICTGLYFIQEKLIFFPDKLDKNYKFLFNQPFEEINIRTQDGSLNGLLFRSDSSKGLIFYLHGNASSLDNWGKVAPLYTGLHYDVFILDYPGYGKSDGAIKSEQRLFSDVQTVYDKLKERFAEDRIIILGYSIGTGLAAKVASTNHPRMLIMQAPYYNMTDMMRRTYPIIPTFLLKYKFKTNEYLKNCKMPVIIFHGTQDDVIYYGSSVRLKKELKPQDTLITLVGQGHNGITDNQEYIAALKRILK